MGRSPGERIEPAEVSQGKAQRGREAFNSALSGETLVQREQFMQQGCPRAPVTDDEDRLRIEHAFPNSLTENEPLNYITARIDERADKASEHEGDPRR